MATKKLSKSEIKKGKCNYPDPPDEGLPIWMGTFADMMTLLFAFFVLLFSMSTLDPVKYSGFQNSKADKTGGTTKGEETGMPPLSQSEIKQELDEMVVDLKEEIIEKMKENIENSSQSSTKKEFEIQELDEKEPLNVSHDPRGVALELDGEICFGSGSVNLKEEIKILLKQASELMKNENDKREILIEGHTDNAPVSGDLEEKYKNNWGLSSFRASEVVTHLIDSLEVPKHRLRAIGYADQWPSGISWSQVRDGSVTPALIDSLNKSDVQKEKNRRIKIIFATR